MDHRSLPLAATLFSAVTPGICGQRKICNRPHIGTENQPVVAFSAVLNTGGDFGPFRTITTVAFNDVVTNIPNYYNKDTGVFAAPVDGVYYFSFFYHAGGKHPAGLQLFKNGKMIIQTGDHASDSDRGDNGGNAAVLRLKKGDTVDVRLPGGSFVWGANGATTFTGFLISQT